MELLHIDRCSHLTRPARHGSLTEREVAGGHRQRRVAISVRGWLDSPASVSGSHPVAASAQRGCAAGDPGGTAGVLVRFA